MSPPRPHAPTVDEVERVTRYLAQVASDTARQAGVGGMETAGAIVSYLARNPETVPILLAGGPADLPIGFHVAGCLSWHGQDGKIHHPGELRREQLQ